MNNFLDQLNLTPQERRIVVGIGMVLIVVLNLLFVWPHFSEWSRIRRQLGKMRSDIETYNKEIALDTNPTNGLQKQLAKLVRQEGAGVMNEQVQLQSTIRTQARKTGVNVPNINPGGERPQTNEFFEEESIRITIDSQEPQLIDFLYNIGNDPAMIRVSELDLAPQDQNRYRLRGFVTFIANYAKRTPAPASAAAKRAIPGTKAAAAAADGKPAPGAKPGLHPDKPGFPGQRRPIPQGQPRGSGPPGLVPPPRMPVAPQRKTSNDTSS